MSADVKGYLITAAIAIIAVSVVSRIDAVDQVVHNY